MSAALGWGALAASSLVIGALLGTARPWHDRLVGLVLAFGAGALISAVSFDLAQEGARLGDPGVLAVLHAVLAESTALSQRSTNAPSASSASTPSSSMLAKL